MIQMLTLNGDEDQFKEKDIVVSKIHEAVSFDFFDINIINLQDKNIWRNDTNNYSVCIQNDFISLSQIIENTAHAYIIILLPQNYDFKFNLYDYQYKQSCEIKDMLSNIRTYILSKLWAPLEFIDWFYEINITKLIDIECHSEFCFQEMDAKPPFTRSEKSNKLTTINFGKILLSTICLDDGKSVKSFLEFLNLIQDNQVRPEWMNEIKMFDDTDLEAEIEEKTKIIEQQKEDIDEAKETLEKNHRYESILYTNENKLVEVVFEILENMLGCDLSSFVDELKEDFNFKINDMVFVGEIKGVSKNVNYSNVSQIDRHVQFYKDENDGDYKNVVGILIINHQRDKSLKDRAKVDKDQIELAEKYGVLIVETITLLKMYEKYLSNEINREQCINILATNFGLLNLEDITF